MTNLTSLPEPLSNPTLTVIPNLAEMSEGDHLYLICGVKGTPPVTFKWYRSDSKLPLNTTISFKNNTNYQISRLSKQHSGKYHCEAVNHASKVVRSDPVIIEGEAEGCFCSAESRPARNKPQTLRRLFGTGLKC